MLREGISTIISVVLMLAITTALIGTAYMYTSGVFSSSVQGIEIIEAHCIRGICSIMIRNIGTTTISSLDVEQTAPAGDTSAQDWSGQLFAGGTITYTDPCVGSESRTCIYNIMVPNGKTTKAIVQCMDVYSTTLLCKADGAACTTGSECCNHICQAGTCVSICGACGTACSEGTYPYTDGTHSCDGDVNDACNLLNGVWYACTLTGDSRDADCTANCQTGLSYCTSGGDTPPFYWGRCIDLQNDDCSCGFCGNVCPSGSTCQSGVCVVVNLVSNPSFEADKTGWGTGAGDWTIVTDQKWHGSKSSRFVDTIADAGSEQTGDQSIPVNPGGPIAVSLYSKGQNIVLGSSSWHKALLIGRWINATGGVIAGYYPDMQIGDGVGTWDWKRSWATFTPVADAVYYRFSVGLRGSATGTLWADAVQVEYGSAPSDFVP